jgi:peroxiredoxin
MRITQTFLSLLGLFFVQQSLALDLDEAVLAASVEIYNGDAVEFKDIIGKKPIYLKFWASWCGTCLEQMNHLQDTYQEYTDDLEILSVNIWMNETEEMLEATEKEFGLTVPIAVDRTGEVARAFDFIATPYHVLIDRDGEVVHRGHKADDDLDRKIEILAAREKSDLPTMALTSAGGKTVDISGESGEVSVLFFTAAWCDWYLKDSRPSMSRACVQAQKSMNKVHELLPDLDMLGVVSRSWTGENELQEYIEKYAVKHPIAIDETNDAFFALKVKTFPTMVVMKNGTEVYRTSKLDSADYLTGRIRQFTN